METVNSEPMSLNDDDLNDMDRWIVRYLSEHEWATPNLMRAYYNDEQSDERDHVSRQWISSRIQRLREHDHVDKVHPDASEYQLVADPRND
jgi:hypothetical protein